MAQVSSYQVPAHPSGLDMRTQLNAIILALIGDNSGPVAPTVTYVQTVPTYYSQPYYYPYYYPYYGYYPYGYYPYGYGGFWGGDFRGSDFHRHGFHGGAVHGRGFHGSVSHSRRH